jgi:ribose 5-phosphate isomerase A
VIEPIELKKKLAGEKAVEYIQDGMTIGLGSGSTVYWTIKKLAELIQQGMNIKGIPSSKRTEGWANEFGIPLTDFSQIQTLDLAVDGADEVDQHFNLIKGGGGSLLREKLVDASSSMLIIVVDDSKMVLELGKYPLPVEVVPFGWEVTAQRISSLGCVPTLRRGNNEIYISNNGNYILDCQFDSVPNPEELHKQLKLLLGVVETGLFVGMTDKVIVGEADGVTILEK